MQMDYNSEVEGRYRMMLGYGRMIRVGETNLSQMHLESIL